ncbi:MAG: hypothetical protein ACTSVV_17120 [Promethearchaeota archaeon]
MVYPYRFFKKWSIKTEEEVKTIADKIVNWIYEHKEEFLKEWHCIQCGGCCRTYAGTLSASDNDIEKWKGKKVLSNIGMHKMLDFVDFELGDLFFHPITKEELFNCPFLRKVRKKDKYTCLINDFKPDECINYQNKEVRFDCRGTKRLIFRKFKLKSLGPKKLIILFYYMQEIQNKLKICQD